MGELLEASCCSKATLAAHIEASVKGTEKWSAHNVSCLGGTGPHVSQQYLQACILGDLLHPAAAVAASRCRPQRVC
jgi:hypothetical protein